MSKQTRTVVFVITTMGIAATLLAMRMVSSPSSLPASQAQLVVSDVQSGDGGAFEPLLDGPCDGCGCTPSCSGNCCVSADCSFSCESGGGGGSNPPQPTSPPQPPPPGGGTAPPPGATEVAGPPVVDGCGDWECDPGESCSTCPGDCGWCFPTATPRPWDADEEVTYHCMPWGDCPGGWADVTMAYHRATNSFYVVSVVCLEESACVAPTPLPNVTPTPPGSGWPCNYAPIIVNGILRQPCEQWPGWSIEAIVSIPPAPILRNPWPRGIVGVENCFWYLGSNDVESWSGMAVECPNAADGVTSDTPTFDCGNGTIVGEGAQVNHQVGAAWRQWNTGDDPVFGYTPPDEVTWVIRDREWNGGTTMRAGPQVCYTFETSSYGLEEIGPIWNPECQEEECADCDERILDYLGEESYEVDVSTFWWPEYSFKHLEYECSHVEWSDCGCYSEEPHGQPNRRGCSAPPGICIQDGEWYGKVGHCDEWKWEEVQEGWEKYNLTRLGFANPVLPSTGVVVAGADENGNQCGEFTDRWPCYVPVPVIEVQPVAPGWYN